MTVKQLSIFVENEKGSLIGITDILRENNIDIRALSLADTTSFGVLRLIVNQPQKAVEVLKESGYTVSLTNVVCIGISDTPGELANALTVLSDNDITVEYMYAFISRKENQAYIILRLSDIEKGTKVIAENNIDILSEKDICV